MCEKTRNEERRDVVREEVYKVDVSLKTYSYK